MATLPAYLKSTGAGALSGGALGSSFGPLGAILGSLLGGGAGALTEYLSPSGQQPNTIGGAGNAFTGYNASAQQFPRFSSGQQSGMEQLLQRGLSNSNFDNIDKYARQQFNQKTIPSLANRFSSFGNNELSSPDFVNQLGEHASNLDAQLASLRSQHGLQELQYGLQPSFENIYTPAQPGFAHNATSPEGLSQIVSLLTQLLSNLRK